MSDTNTATTMTTARGLIKQLLHEGEKNRELKRTDPFAYKAKMEAILPVQTCCLCRESFKVYGNSPQPLLEHGVACETCNVSIVLTTRKQT